MTVALYGVLVLIGAFVFIAGCEYIAACLRERDRRVHRDLERSEARLHASRDDDRWPWERAA